MFGRTIVKKKYLATLLFEVARLHRELWIANYNLRLEREVNAIMAENCDKAAEELDEIVKRLEVIA